MTPLNTIIEEEKIEFWSKFAGKNPSLIPKSINTWLTTAMQRAYEAGRRDTVEEMKGEVRLLASKHYKTEDFDIEGFINDLGLLQHNNKEELKDISKDV